MSQVHAATVPKAQKAQRGGAMEARRTRARRGRRGRRTGRLLPNLAGLAVFVVVAFPSYWMVSTALKSNTGIFSTTPQFVPTELHWSNFGRAMDRQYFWDSIRNSLIIGLGAVAASLVIGFLAALAIARFRFYGRRAFFITIIIVQMIPANSLFIPLYLLLNKAHLTDRLLGAGITYLALTLPFTVWLLRGFVAGIPVELEEAAQIDGCSRMAAFFRIVLPLVAPGLVATSIFSFIQSWNEFLLANVLLTSEQNRTVSLWLFNFVTLRGTDWTGLMAGSTLVALPAVILFLLLHRRMVSGLVAGAVKG
jgi:N,N'-diacetylchitobiose transport system permease protein